MCKSPKIIGIFKQNVTGINKVSLDAFCAKDVSPFTLSQQIADEIYKNLDYNFVSNINFNKNKMLRGFF